MGAGPIAGIVIGVVIVSLIIYLISNYYWKEYVYQKKLVIWKAKQARLKEEARAQ
jgi:hypothetical protein